MSWMNRSDIEEAITFHARRPVCLKAAKFLKEFQEQVDRVSDGWPYWSLPSRAAAKLMELIERKPEDYRGVPRPDITEAQLAKALVPIKSFYTRRGYQAGMTFPEVH
jgi:hypothetical protein